MDTGRKEEFCNNKKSLSSSQQQRDCNAANILCYLES